MAIVRQLYSNVNKIEVGFSSIHENLIGYAYRQWEKHLEANLHVAQ